MKKSMMKKLVVLLVVMVIAGGFVFGATADLTLVASMDEILSISITEEALADTIDLSAGVTGGNVATATVNSNVLEGYKITATSVNADGVNARLLNTNGTENFYVGYSLTFGGSNVSFDGTTVVYSSDANAIFEGTTHAIDLTVAADDGTYRAGEYTDTVTFTIAAN